MKDKVFLDTNILVYSYSNNELKKQKIAQNLITNNNTVISTQVLQELINIVTKKIKLNYNQALLIFNESIKNNELYINSETTISKACNIANDYHFSFYDSLIIASALEINTTILYSEDLHHNQIINNKLQIINPFKL